MNFQWSDDIYDDKPSSFPPPTPEEFQSGEDFILPNYFKSIGIFIILAPIVLKTLILYFPQTFAHIWHPSNITILVFIAAGVLIESHSWPRVLTWHDMFRRYVIKTAAIILFFVLLPKYWHSFFD